MAESLEGLVWQRLATPRETMFGLRSDGTIRCICSNLKILSSVKIKQEVLERCAEHFNSDMCGFHEFLVENNDSKDIWLVKTEKNGYMVEEVETEDEIETKIIEDEINFGLRAEDNPNWKVYYCYVGYDLSGGAGSEKYPHVYQLIFSFSTGTLDEFSCAVMCDFFLNILDCALRDVPFQRYSHLKMYDVGSKLENKITETIQVIQNNERQHKSLDKIYRKMINNATCSNFELTKREVENKCAQFRTMKYLFSRDDTQRFLNICKKKDMDIYAVFIVFFNNVLLDHAKKNGFNDIFCTRVLHNLDARYILNIKDKKCNLGSYSLPFMHHFTLKSTEVDEIFVEASRVEKKLKVITAKNIFWNQEALRELIIKGSEFKYNSGKWNPHYCFSVTNLGNLDPFYSLESPNNKFRVLSYERSSSALEGGHLDIVFYIFNGKFNVYFDFSKEYFSDIEMENIIKRFTHVVQSIVK